MSYMFLRSHIILDNERGDMRERKFSTLMALTSLSDGPARFLNGSTLVKLTLTNN